MTEEPDPIISFEDAYLSGAKWNKGDLHSLNLSKADLSGADLNSVQQLESAFLNKTILRGVKGLTTEQLAGCKASGAIIDEEATPSTPPSPSATIPSSQEAKPEVSSSANRVATSTQVQETTPEVIPSQEKTVVEKGTTSPTLPSSDRRHLWHLPKKVPPQHRFYKATPRSHRLPRMLPLDVTKVERVKDVLLFFEGQSMGDVATCPASLHQDQFPILGLTHIGRDPI